MLHHAFVLGGALVMHFHSFFCKAFAAKQNSAYGTGIDGMMCGGLKFCCIWAASREQARLARQNAGQKRRVLSLHIAAQGVICGLCSVHDMCCCVATHAELLRSGPAHISCAAAHKPAGWRLAGLPDFAVRCMTGVFLLPALGLLAHSLLWVRHDMSSERACLLHS